MIQTASDKKTHPARRKVLFAVALAAWGICAVLFYFFYLKPVSITGNFYTKIHGARDCISVFGITPTGKWLPFDTSSMLENSKNYYGLYEGTGISFDTTTAPEGAEIEIRNENQIKVITLYDVIRSWEPVYNMEQRRVKSYRAPLGFFPETTFFAKWNAAFKGIWWLRVFAFLILFIIAFYIYYSRVTKFIKAALSLLKKTFSKGLQRINITGERKHKIKTALIASVLTAVVFLSIIYGYLLFRFVISGFITWILIVFWMCFILSGIVYLLLYKKYLRKKRKRLIMLITIAGLLLIGAEGIVRSTGFCYTINEKQGNYYKSGFNSDYLIPGTPWLRYEPKTDTQSYQGPEFNFEYYINSEGLRDREHAVQKQTGTYRILCIGNSFTEGIGTSQDSTWPALLEKHLTFNNGPTTEVMNAGVASNDIFFTRALYNHQLKKYKPDLVILAIGPIEYLFYRFRGGMERFREDGSVVFREPPVWENLYAVSHLYRITVKLLRGYDHSFLTPDEKITMQKNASRDIRYAVDQLGTEIKSDGGDFAVVVFPEVSTFLNDDPLYFKLLQELQSLRGIKTFDLYSYFKDREGIDAKKAMKYYWPVDGHPTPRGYAVFARGVKYFIVSDSIIPAEYGLLNFNSK